MNTLPTYETQFNKITEAYIKGEMQPAHPSFCFCGTLCNNQRDWFRNPLREHYDFNGYSGNDFVRMERALFSEITTKDGFGLHQENTPEYEQDLFNGMCAALEVLKQIHIEKGEIIDEVPQFQKRKLKSL